MITDVRVAARAPVLGRGLQVLGDGDADGHLVPTAASRLPAAVAPPPTAVTTPDIVLRLGWEARSDAAVWSLVWLMCASLWLRPRADLAGCECGLFREGWIQGLVRR